MDQEPAEGAGVIFHHCASCGWVRAALVVLLSPPDVEWEYEVCPVCGWKICRHRVERRYC